MNTHTIAGTKPARWRCTECGLVATWEEGDFCYKGALAECKQCGWAPIERVLCGSCTKAAGLTRFMDDEDLAPKKPRKTTKRKRSRAP
jgi:hypothetical protein